MTKYILVGGYLHKAKDGGKAFCEELVKDLSTEKPVIILDCMFARPEDSWEIKLKCVAFRAGSIRNNLIL